MRPDELTNEMINEIGQTYLTRYPRGGVLTFLFRKSHHGFADSLSNYNKNSTPQEKWNFLLSIYKMLNRDFGFMSAQIEKYFEQAFNLQDIPKKKIMGMQVGHIYEVLIPLDEIHDSLQKKIDNHFNNRWASVQYTGVTPSVAGSRSING